MAHVRDKYLNSIELHRVRILEFYSLHREKKPVMLLDVREQKIYAYPCKTLIKNLNKGERLSLTKQYDEALRRGQFVLFIRDSENEKLVSYSLKFPGVEQSCRFEDNDHSLKDNSAAASAARRVVPGTRQPYRIRRPGAGRKLTEEKDPTIVEALEQMLKDEVAGDPMIEQRWIRSSLRRLSERLADQGHQACAGVVARLLTKLGFSLKASERKQGRLGCLNRDEQFTYIASQKQQFITAGLPIISIDTKKKELIGNFRNKGRTWSRQAEEVNEHDFPGAAKCRAIPFGIYDPARNEGYVFVGVSNDTPQFAVYSIARWWEGEGRRAYQGARALLILADSGGSNGCRARAWKLSIQEKLCDESGLTVTVCHYPTGCSK